MHKKESQAELAARLHTATTQVVVGARYMHYKQLSYIVLALALREEDNEPCVVYKAEYGNNITFIRPVANWIEEVHVDGKKMPRFQYSLPLLPKVKNATKRSPYGPLSLQAALQPAYF